ncbi:MAG: hypothetical protein HOC70_00145 [Gammaproteobacteria bacterium]|jgi:hypothetical protein|nr:hypothetical protein [Gammaproteobacteria bacterium]MBT7371251.1 hypothetical protein [Gammaproteobacteria bacterium]
MIIRLLPIFLFLLNACSSVPAPETSSDERLLVTVTNEWEQVFQMNSGSTRLTDFVLKGETADNWTTKLAFESYRIQDIVGDPIDLLLSEAKTDESRCSFVQHFNISSGYENRYETSVRLFLCGENAFSTSGEVKLVKAIRGNDYLYSIRLIRRVEPFDLGQQNFTDQQMAIWSAYLGRITLCDESTEHPCPEPTNKN